MKQDNEHRPAYLRLYERLRGEIVRGDYPFGARMPSKRQLAEEEGLSVVTVEHAYALLTDEGYLEARRRSGHYVQFHDTDGFVPSAPVKPAAIPAGMAPRSSTTGTAAMAMVMMHFPRTVSKKAMVSSCTYPQKTAPRLSAGALRRYR